MSKKLVHAVVTVLVAGMLLLGSDVASAKGAPPDPRMVTITFVELVP